MRQYASLWDKKNINNAKQKKLLQHNNAHEINIRFFMMQYAYMKKTNLVSFHVLIKHSSLLIDTQTSIEVTVGWAALTKHMH